MSRLLYYSLSVSETHAGLNTYPTNTYVNLGNGIVAPGLPEWQREGEANFWDYFNNNAAPDEVWAHFTVESETFEKPADFGSKITYDTYFFGNHGTATYPKWGSVLVPDTFVIPSEYDHGELAAGWSNLGRTEADSADFSWSG